MTIFKHLLTCCGISVALTTLSTLAHATDTIKIGSLYPQSGALALLGQESSRGLDLAVEMLNKKGGLLGKRIDIVAADAVNPTQAVSEAKRLVSDNVVAVFGSYASGISYAATPVTELAGVPYFELGAVAHKITNRGYKYLFRSNPNATLYGQSVVDTLDTLIAPKMGLKKDDIKIGIIHEDGPYGTEVAAAEKTKAKELGYNVVQVLPYSAKTVDLSSLILRLKGSKVNVVLQTSYQNDSVLYFRQAKAANFKPLITIGAGGGYSLKDTATAVGSDIEGVFDLDFPQPSIKPDFAPGLNDFLTAYEQKYKSKPQSGHSLANYVGALAFFDIIEKAQSTDKDKIREAVLNYKKEPATSANGWGFGFGEDGQNVSSEFYVMQWQNNELVTIYPEKFAQKEGIYKK
ncbi:ABC transporter substrate-binding protein [Pelistega europaea]|uniref:ABC transporter substrate-binding protein n=1 Tax=Pelistega europaea TaxID=106147 RepID=A0A7Y4P654_9BURK|nr:ABC transporter substrate-binding protein [Pelistega europaea]NOL50443.1 ABC transporter substrate-binding protein [Pelistega europaea]